MTQEQYANAKKYVNRTNLLSMGVFGLVLVASVVFSIPSITFDPSQVFTMTFLTKELVSLAIGVSSWVCWLFIGRQGNSLQEMSKLNLSRKAFNQTRSLIQDNDENFNAFEQWVENKFHIQEQEKKDKLLLRSVGVKSTKYLDLDFNTLKELKLHTMKIDNVYYKQINKEQYDTIIQIQTGKTRIKFIKWCDYLSEKSYGKELQMSEIIAREVKDLQALMLREIISKVIFGFIISAIFISVIVEKASASGDMTPEEVSQHNWQIVINLISRLFNALFSATMGAYVGKKLNDEASMYLGYKSIVHKMFLNDKNFKAKSEEQLAREEWLKEQKEINKKANEDYANKLGLRDEEDTNVMLPM